MPNWKKVIVSGSDASLNSVFANSVTASVFSGSFTGSLQGTSSWAVSASWAPGGGGASFPYTGSAVITGSLVVTGSLTATSGAFLNGIISLGTSSPYRQLTISNPTQAFLAFSSSAYRNYTIGSDPSGFIIYDDTGGGYRAAIDSNGNFAIGSNAPAYRLDVQGGRMRILNTNAGSSPGLWLAGTGTEDVFVGLQGNTSTSAFGIYSGGTWQLTMLNGGNVGLGTTSPTAKLQVVGNVSASSFTGSLLGTASFATSASQAISSSYSITASFALDIDGGLY